MEYKRRRREWWPLRMRYLESRDGCFNIKLLKGGRLYDILVMMRDIILDKYFL